MVAAIVTANVVALAVYFGAKVTGNAERMSGSFLYDFFVGAWLNPRIGMLDLKMWAEIRVSWTALFLLTASGAAHQYAAYGAVSTPMIFMVIAPFPLRQRLYEGRGVHPHDLGHLLREMGMDADFLEPCRGCPSSTASVPCTSRPRPPFELSTPYTVFLFVLLFGAYYVWETANGQRNRFRMRPQRLVCETKVVSESTVEHSGKSPLPGHRDRFQVAHSTGGGATPASPTTPQTCLWRCHGD